MCNEMKDYGKKIDEKTWNGESVMANWQRGEAQAIHRSGDGWRISGAGTLQTGIRLGLFRL